MALRAGYYGVKRRIWEALQNTVSDDTQEILNIKTGQSLMGSVNNLNLTAVTTTQNNVTITVDTDGIVSVETTAAGASITTFFPLESYKKRTGQKIYVKGCPAGGGMANYALQIRAQDQSSVGIEDGAGKWFEFDADDNALYALGIRINSGTKIITPIKFYPVLTLTDIDYPFAPYAMTNQQLTASANDQKAAINAIITAATGATDFAAFKTAMAAITPVTRSATPDVRSLDAEVEEPTVVKKSITRKSTKKTEEEE